jgi:hypothetical protein
MTSYSVFSLSGHAFSAVMAGITSAAALYRSERTLGETGREFDDDIGTHVN